MGTGWRRAFCTTIPRDNNNNNKVEKLQQNEEHLHLEKQSINQQVPISSPRSCGKLGFLSGGSSSPCCTPRLQQQSQNSVINNSPRLRCKINSSSSSSSSSLLLQHSSDNKNNDTFIISPNKLHCRTTTITPKSSSSSSSTTKSPRLTTTFRSSNPSSPRSPFSILKNTLRLSNSKNSCGVCMQSVKTGQGMAIYTAECSHTFHFPCIAGHVRNQTTLTCPVCKSLWKDVPLLSIHKLHHHDQIQLKDKEIAVDNTLNFQTPPSTVKTKPEQPSKAYNDDEPLLSPPPGAKFIPIPEAAAEEEEDDDDEVEEFQGFFVNPIPSDEAVSSKDLRNVEVNLLPEAAVITSGRTHETFTVVLKVKAPPPPPPAHNNNNTAAAAHLNDPASRAPIDLVTVLDVSGSMSGAKLHMLKRAMRLVISSLGSADRLSIVSFSANPQRLMPLKRMNSQGQRLARRIIDRLACSQGTSVNEALRKATKILEDRRERNPVASIILLSDGQDEKVQPNTTDNQRQRSTTTPVSSTRFAHIEIPVHSSGFGAKSRYTREPAENEEDAFSKCVGGLLSVVVQDLRIQLGFANGSDPAEITAVYSCNVRPTALVTDCIRLGDLYAEEEKEFLVEIRVPASAFGSHHVLSVRCSYKDPATQEIVYGREQALLVPRAQTVRSTSQPRIERLRNLFITTRAIAESRRLIEHGELTSATHLLSSARALLLQSRCDSVEDYVKGLEGELNEVNWRRQNQQQQKSVEQQQQRRKMNDKEIGLLLDETGEPLTPSSAWRAAEKLAKVASIKKSVNRVSDLHGFENARF